MQGSIKLQSATPYECKNVYLNFHGRLSVHAYKRALENNVGIEKNRSDKFKQLITLKSLLHTFEKPSSRGRRICD